MTEERKGELALAGGIFLWVFFPIAGVVLLKGLPSVFVAGVSTLFASLFLAIILTIKRQWGDFFKVSVWKEMLYATFFITIMFYALLFIGMKYTSAGNVALITMAEVLFAFLILGFWKKEAFTKEALFGAFLLLVGGLLVVFQGSFSLNVGDLIVLLAVIFPPVGNYFQQKVRRELSSTHLLFFRSFVGGLFLCLLSFLLGESFSVNISQLGILALFGIVFFGIQKIFWIEAIHRIPITKANALGCIEPAFTLVFAYFLLGEVPTIWQVAGFIPMLFGTWFILFKKDIFKILH